jgi:hypothetical protein
MLYFKANMHYFKINMLSFKTNMLAIKTNAPAFKDSAPVVKDISPESKIPYRRFVPLIHHNEKVLPDFQARDRRRMSWS